MNSLFVFLINLRLIKDAGVAVSEAAAPVCLQKRWVRGLLQGRRWAAQLAPRLCPKCSPHWRAAAHWRPELQMAPEVQLPLRQDHLFKAP